MSRGNASPDDDDVVSIELGVSRRKLMKQLSAVGLTGGLTSVAGCNSLRGDNQAQATESSDGEDGGGDGGDGGGSGDALPPALRVPLVPPPTADEMDLSNPQPVEREMVFVSIVLDEFQQTIIAGLNDGLKNIGWTGEFIAPQQHDMGQQLELMRSTINRMNPGEGVIALPILDENQYRGPIQTAYENDIPVVGANTNVYAGRTDQMMETFDNYIPYVGQDFVPAGIAIAQDAVQRAREKFGADEEIVALPTIIAPGSSALQSRVEGIRRGLEAADNVRVVETLDTGEDLSQAISRIQDRYRSNPDINMVAASAAVDTAAAGRFVENESVQDEMVAVGFDATDPIIEGIQEGNIDSTAGQDGYSQGYLSTQIAWEYLDRGVPMKDYNTGIAVIDESNIEFVAKRNGSIPDLINWQDDNYSL